MDLKIKKDLIREFYYEGVENLQNNFNTKEYKNISKKIRKIENKIFEDVNEATREKIETYMEYITERESIESEQQFKTGFKTAMKLMIEVFDDK